MGGIFPGTPKIVFAWKAEQGVLSEQEASPK